MLRALVSASSMVCPAIFLDNAKPQPTSPAAVRTNRAARACSPPFRCSAARPVGKEPVNDNGTLYGIN